MDLANGKPVECLINLHSLQRWGEESGNDLGDFEKVLQTEPFKHLPSILWSGVRAAYEVTDEVPPLSEGSFKAILGSSDLETISAMMGDAVNLMVERQKKRPPKKKESP